MFASMMFLDTVIFMIMSLFYTYRPVSLAWESISLSGDINLDSDTVKLLRPKSGEQIPLQIKSGEQIGLEIGIPKKSRNRNP